MVGTALGTAWLFALPVSADDALLFGSVGPLSSMIVSSVFTDDTPAVKVWCGLVDHLQGTTGWPRERVVSVLKSMPTGKRVRRVYCPENF